MTDRKPTHTQPEEVPTDVPDEEAVERNFAEGQIPGMPVSRDPLLNPGPTPPQVERKPLD